MAHRLSPTPAQSVSPGQAGIALIGFGETAQAFAAAWGADAARVRAYDRKTDCPNAREPKLGDYRRLGIAGKRSAAEALSGAKVVLSMVWPDQALPAAMEYADLLGAGALWLDLNSVAPDTKRAAAAEIEAAGGRYVDVAVPAPVAGHGLAVPLLVSGPHAAAAASTLGAIGFQHIDIVPGAVGAAAAILLIRSVMVKGMEALTTECLLAAEAAGVRGEVVASLNAGWPGVDWGECANLNLERIMAYSLRHSSEMDEVVKTLDTLGTGSTMTRGTVERQRTMGAVGFGPALSLQHKLGALLRTTRLAKSRATGT